MADTATMTESSQNARNSRGQPPHSDANAPEDAHTEQDNASPQKRIVRNVSILMAGRALNAPLALLHTSLAIRLLGAHDFGLIVLLYAFARTVGDIADFQSWQTVLNFGSESLGRRDINAFHRILRFGLTLDIAGGLFGALIGAAFAWLGRDWLGWPDSLALLGPLYATSIFFMASATPVGILRLLNKYSLISAQSVVATVVRLVGTLILWAWGGSVTAMAAVWMLAEFASCVTLFGFSTLELAKRDLLRGLLERPGQIFEDLFRGGISRAFPGVWRFALTTNLNSTLTLAFGHIGTLVIGGMLGPVSASYYRVGSQIAAGIAKPATLVQSTLYPEMTRLWNKRDTLHLYVLAVRAALAAGALGSVLLCFAWFLGGPILQIVIGPHGADALPLTMWLLGAEVVAIWGLPLEPLLFTMRRIGAVIIARGLDAMLYLPLLVLTTEWYGLDGAGPAILGATVFLVLMQLGFVWRLSGAKPASVDVPPKG